MATVNVLMTFHASFQLASPLWLASTDTVPGPVKDKFPPTIVAEPALTVNVTGKPLDAVAASPTVFVVN